MLTLKIIGLSIFIATFSVPEAPAPDQTHNGCPSEEHCYISNPPCPEGMWCIAETSSCDSIGGTCGMRPPRPPEVP